LSALIWLTGAPVYAQSWQLLTVRLQADAIAGSFDGSKLVAVGSGGVVALSTNWGENWAFCGNLPTIPTNSPDPTNPWYSAACSADGSVIVLGGMDFASPLCISTNGGASWSYNGSPVATWSTQPGAVAVSADGRTMVAVAGNGWLEPGPVYVSTNQGAS
jgi:hypothetical protein